jgi:hypothetical protein
MHDYYPYFRGKQNELITIRENAKLLKEAGFVPIIEPVKQSTSGLQRAIHEVVKEDGQCILIVNPKCGDHCADSAKIKRLINKDFAGNASLSVGILLTSLMSANDVRALCDEYPSRDVTLIHYGFEEGSNLARVLINRTNVTRHVFIDDFCGKLYRKHFRDDGRSRILIKDGFQRRKNREHGEHPSELFSDLHVTFDEESMDGFGDFLIVGDDYFESGGPAFAVAIHLTYIDQKRDEAMYIHHFVSNRTDTQADPGGKFGEALEKLVDEVNKPDSPILRSAAVAEFLDLHNNTTKYRLVPHFPGLGYAKKLSMQHHIETLADYFRRQGKAK